MAQVSAADVAFIGGHATHVVGVLLDEVGVEVAERLAHLAGVLLVDAEDDRLAVAVGARQVVGEVARHRLRAGAQRHHALEVGGRVLLVGDRVAVAVELALARAPAGGVPLGDNTVHTVRGEEAVVDALPQAVGVDRCAEVGVGIDVVLALRRRRHADLVGGREVLEDLAPVALVLGTAAVTLIDDHEVEEVGRVLAVEPGPSLVTGDRLVDGEVHLAALHHDATLDLVARVAERRELLILGVVDQDVAVGEVEDARLAPLLALGVPARRPEPPTDLEGDVGLAGAGGHREQDARLTLEHGLDGAVDRRLLVVARVAAGLTVAGGLQRVGGLVGELLAGPATPPEVDRRREGRQLSLEPGRVIELDHAVAVGRVGELEAEDLGIVLGLLQALARGLVLGLGLDHGNGDVGGVAEDVVGALAWAAARLLAGHDDAPVGERALRVDAVRFVLPPGRLELRLDVQAASISFVAAHAVRTCAAPFQRAAPTAARRGRRDSTCVVGRKG